MLYTILGCVQPETCHPEGVTMPQPDASRTTPRHSIAVVSRRTGLTQLLLRAWERRYQVVEPSRTDTGRRLYTDEDVERLTLLRILTDNGYRIGDVVGRPPAELRTLAAEAAPAPAPAPSGRTGTADPRTYLSEALDAVQAMDQHRLESVLERASVDLAIPVLRRGLIQPLMIQIGERWREGTLRVAQEHMATAIVKTFLSSLNARQTVADGSPLLAVATPSGDLHEMGALLATSHALEVGWDVLYMGPNLPAEEIAGGIRLRTARALFLSIVYPPGDAGIGEQILLLRRLLDPDFPVIVGGRAAGSYQEILDKAGAIRVDGPGDFDLALNHILSH